MWDKLDIEIPFDALFVNEFNGVKEDERAGFIKPNLYDFDGIQLVKFVDGQPVVESTTSKKWDSLSFGLSQMAVGFFPEGNGFNSWPHVRIKASPTKILQGHNVFGSESLREGFRQMILMLRLGFPKIFQHLDIDNAHVCYVDCTYSAKKESRFFVNHIFKFLENLANSRSKINRNTDYLQLGTSSEYNRQKFYMKDQELQADYEQAKKRRETDRIQVLGDPRLKDWAHNLIRLEATVGKRRMIDLGIPNDIKGFLKFHDWYEKTHGEPLARYLWRQCFASVFKKIEGHTMSNMDDDAIKAAIDKEFITYKTNLKTGKVTVSKRKANAVFNTYRQIKLDGYHTLIKQDNSSFFRNVKHLEQCGISKAVLMQLGPYKSIDNVIPMVRLLNVDFSKQRPDWYQEPVAGYDDRRRHLKVVA